LKLFQKQNIFRITFNPLHVQGITGGGNPAVAPFLPRYDAQSAVMPR